jgi:predicted metalloprotease with PDZ domain
MDGLIRESSSDQRSLDDFMGRLWQRHGPGRPGYTVATLDSLASAVAGTELGRSFARSVETEGALPVDECLARLGLGAATKGYAAEVFIFPARNPRPGAASRGRSLYGPRAR